MLFHFLLLSFSSVPYAIIYCRVQIKAVPYRCEDWSSRERLAILAMCNKLSATIGGCERLVQTPVPLHYVRHTSRFLTIWCLLLPLVIGELVVHMWIASFFGGGIEPFSRTM